MDMSIADVDLAVAVTSRGNPTTVCGLLLYAVKGQPELPKTTK